MIIDLIARNRKIQAFPDFLKLLAPSGGAAQPRAAPVKEAGGAAPLHQQHRLFRPGAAQVCLFFPATLQRRLLCEI
jgi:hypothetical protein